MLFAGHGGLLDVVLDPDHASNGLLYFSYIHGTEEAAAVRIMRAQLKGMQLTGQEVIFESYPPVSGTDQFGGRLAIGSDGLLYATLGDRFRGGPAQDLGDHAGSIVRIKRDGHTPEDNPFVGFPERCPKSSRSATAIRKDLPSNLRESGFGPSSTAAGR